MKKKYWTIQQYTYVIQRACSRKDTYIQYKVYDEQGNFRFETYNKKNALKFVRENGGMLENNEQEEPETESGQSL